MYSKHTKDSLSHLKTNRADTVRANRGFLNHDPTLLQSSHVGNRSDFDNFAGLSNDCGL